MSMRIDLSGLPAQAPLSDPAAEAQRQLLMQAIAPLGGQMRAIGLPYQESGGQYILMTSAFYAEAEKKSAMKGLLIGAAAITAIAAAFVVLSD